jgi:hypothetical protein
MKESLVLRHIEIGGFQKQTHDLYRIQSPSSCKVNVDTRAVRAFRLMGFYPSRPGRAV